MRGLQARVAKHENTPPAQVLRRFCIVSDRGHLGLTCANWPESSIGALVIAVEEADLAARAGVCVGDVLVAVNGAAVLSHKHAIQLTDSASAPTIELLVRQPLSRRPPPPHPDACPNPSTDATFRLPMQPRPDTSEMRRASPRASDTARAADTARATDGLPSTRPAAELAAQRAREQQARERLPPHTQALHERTRPQERHEGWAEPAQRIAGSPGSPPRMAWGVEDMDASSATAAEAATCAAPAVLSFDSEDEAEAPMMARPRMPSAPPIAPAMRVLSTAPRDEAPRMVPRAPQVENSSPPSRAMGAFSRLSVHSNGSDASSRSSSPCFGEHEQTTEDPRATRDDAEIECRRFAHRSAHGAYAFN